MEGQAAQRKGRRFNWGTLVLVALFHLLALFGLARAFAPDFTNAALEEVASVFTVTITASEIDPPAPPEVEPEPDEGAAGDPGKQAKPRATAAPEPKIKVKPAPPAPKASSDGNDLQSGAREQGDGTGAAGPGDGTGSGRAGGGQGNGFRKLEKIAGDINSAQDYPRKTRKLRIGHSVTVLLNVGPDGRVTSCRVSEASPDAEADQITCALAKDRFRFRPATDSRGNPISGKYAWRQRWFV